MHHTYDVTIDTKSDSVVELSLVNYRDLCLKVNNSEEGFLTVEWVCPLGDNIKIIHELQKSKNYVFVYPKRRNTARIEFRSSV